MPSTRKVTVSLPNPILEAIDSMAIERSAPRSAIIAAMLQEWLQEAEAQQMQEGYLALAKENSAFAEDAVPLASEVMPDWE